MLSALGNEALHIVEEWAHNNKIVYNASKSQVLRVTRKRIVDDVSVYLNGSKLKEVDTLKYLGVTFDKHLSWSYHTSRICDKALKLIGLLSCSAKLHWGLGYGALRTIYQGAILPLLTYAAPVWKDALTRKYNVKKFQRVQRLMALRIIKGYKTISYEAAILLADILPIEFEIAHVSQIYSLTSKSDETNLIYDKPVLQIDWLHPADLPNVVFLDDEDDSHDYLQIYTDGSKQENGVGAAFVVYNDSEICHQGTFNLFGKCTNNQAELLAIEKSLLWLKTYNIRTSISNKKITIYTDSQVSISCIKKSDCHFPLVESCRKLLITLLEYEIKIKIKWIKGHGGIEGNEKADLLAKQAALNDLESEVSYKAIPKSVLKLEDKRWQLKKWEEIWVKTPNASWTKNFFPTISTRKKTDIHLTYKLTQALSGHGSNKAYLHRFKIIPDSSCSCDKTTSQTWTHLIFDCPIFETERSKLISEIIARGEAWSKTDMSVFARLFPLFSKFINSLDFNLF